MTVVAAPVGVELDVTATLAGVVVDAIEAVVDTGAADEIGDPRQGVVFGFARAGRRRRLGIFVRHGARLAPALAAAISSVP